MAVQATSVEPEEGRLHRRRLRLEEPVEKRSPVPLVHRDVAGKLRHAPAPRLAGEARRPVSVLLVAGQQQRARRARQEQ